MVVWHLTPGDAPLEALASRCVLPSVLSIVRRKDMFRRMWHTVADDLRTGLVQTVFMGVGDAYTVKCCHYLRDSGVHTVTKHLIHFDPEVTQNLYHCYCMCGWQSICVVQHWWVQAKLRLQTSEIVRDVGDV